jgi:putative peptidoglycan lipid II flippase
VALLRIFSFVVPAWVIQQIAVRAFYARGDTWRPMLLTTAIALAAAALYWVLGGRYGAPGIAWAGVIGMSASGLATLLFARRLHGGPPLWPVLTTGLRALAAAALAGVVTVGGLNALPLPPIGGAAAALLSLAAGGVIYSATALAAVQLFGDPPMRAMVWHTLRRLRRNGT